MSNKGIKARDVNNSEQKNQAKKRVTVYLTSFEMEIIKKIMSERNISSITDAVSQIIIEYEAHREHHFVDNVLYEDTLENSDAIEVLDQRYRIHDNKLDFLEQMYFSIIRKLHEAKFIDINDSEYMDMKHVYYEKNTRSSSKKRRTSLGNKEAKSSVEEAKIGSPTEN